MVTEHALNRLSRAKWVRTFHYQKSGSTLQWQITITTGINCFKLNGQHIKLTQIQTYSN